MPTKLTYTGAEVQELLDKIEKGDFDNAKTLEGHPASYFAIASEFTSLAESFATEQGRVNTLYSYFNNGSANDALSLGGKLPSYYATATQYEILQRTLSDFKSLFDSMFEKDSDGNIHAKLSLWSSGGITAGGVGSGGSGGGGISYNRLDAWSDYSADKAGYVLSAALGKDLDNRVSALANAGYVTQSALAPYVLRSEVEGQYLSKNGGTVNGSITLSIGNLVVSSGDTVVGKIYPRTDNEYTLGQDTRKWKNILCYNINGSTPVNASNLKPTLGISDWALASAKPTYTASEVGALSVNGGDIGGSLNFRNGSSITCANGIVLEMYAGVDTYLRGSSNIYISAPNVYTQRNVYTYKVLDSGNYSDYALPKTGGTLTGTTSIPLYIKSSHATEAAVGFGANNAKGYGYIVYKGGDSWAVTKEQWGAEYSILHTGNYSNLLAGGTINGSLTATSFIGGTSTISGDLKGLQNLIFADGYLGRKFSLTNSGGIFYQAPSGSVGWATNWSVKSNDGITSFGDLGGAFGVGNSLSYFYYGGEYNAPSIAIMPSGMIAIGGTTADEKLHVHGNGLFAGDIILAPADTSDVSILFRSGTLSDSAYDYKIGKFTDANGKKAFGMAMAKPNGSWVKFFGVSTDGEYNVSKIDLLTNVEVNGTLKTTGALTAASITANSLTIGGATITYDSVNEALCINGNMYALGGITAGGAGISTYSSLESRVARLEQQLNIS